MPRGCGKLPIIFSILFLLIPCRDGGPTIFANIKAGKGVDDIVGLIISAWKSSGAYDVSNERWKKDGKKGSGMEETLKIHIGSPDE